MTKVTKLHKYTWYTIFFICWDNINTEETVDILAKDRQHAERIFRAQYQPFYEPLYIQNILIVETNDLCDEEEF